MGRYALFDPFLVLQIRYRSATPSRKDQSIRRQRSLYARAASTTRRQTAIRQAFWRTRPAPRLGPQPRSVSAKSSDCYSFRPNCCGMLHLRFAILRFLPSWLRHYLWIFDWYCQLVSRVQVVSFAVGEGPRVGLGSQKSESGGWHWCGSWYIC